MLKIYPPVPLPPIEYKLNLQKASEDSLKYIQSSVVQLTDESITMFLATELSQPKVLYFADKPDIPLIYKALSNSFKNKLRLGFVNSSNTEIVSSYGIKKFPAMIVIKSGAKKPIVYQKEFNFKNMFEFLNIFSEQFVPTDSSNIANEKPWAFEAIPEMTDKSVRDICTGLEKTLCLIIFSQGKPAESVFA